MFINYSFSINFILFYICIFKEICSKTINNQSLFERSWNEQWGKIPENVNDIATILFYKYASNYDGLTPSEFEALVQCSRGTSECLSYLKLLDNVDSPYAYITDCEINSDISEGFCDILNRCLDGNEILDNLGLGSSVNGTEINTLITKDELKMSLPFILYQAQSPICINSGIDKEDKIKIHTDKPSSKDVWGYGILFVTLISGLSLAGVSVIPFMAKDFYQKLLTLLIGLAVGSLAASSAFHLIPQAFGLTKTVAHHDYLLVSLWILVGIYAFFMIERIMQMIILYQNKSEKVPEVNHEIKFRQGEDSVIATVAWMIIFGDGFHNFIDGVSIGAAFQESILTGISISLAVMCEELPHELGDFAILLNSGMTMKQAVFYNFLSATTCYAGLVVGILLGEFTENSRYIFALAAGMFLYISLVDMLPEMNATGNKAADKGFKNVLKILLLQNIGLFIGVASLFFLAYYQEQLIIGD